MSIRVPRLSRRPDLFLSAKCSAPIPARHPALRAALVRASLDPKVRSISHVARAHVGSSSIEIDAVVIDRADGRYRLDVVPARRERDAIGESLCQLAAITLDLAPLVVTAEDLAAEPASANRDLVWSHHGRSVPIDLRLQILRILVDDGPLPLDRLLQGVTGRDPAAAVMSLCCDDLLELDLSSGPIGPSTLVRTRT